MTWEFLRTWVLFEEHFENYKRTNSIIFRLWLKIDWERKNWGAQGRVGAGQWEKINNNNKEKLESKLICTLCKGWEPFLTISVLLHLLILHPNTMGLLLTFIHSIQNHFLSTYYQPGTILGTEDTTGTKRDQNPLPCRSYTWILLKSSSTG